MKTYVFSDAHNCDHTYVRLADHDAALRRAKAEVLEDNARLRGAVQECVRCIEVLSMKGVDHDEVHTVDAAIREGWWCSMAIDARTHALVAIQLSKDLDACAAQIEEGE